MRGRADLGGPPNFAARTAWIVTDPPAIADRARARALISHAATFRQDTAALRWPRTRRTKNDQRYSADQNNNAHVNFPKTAAQSCTSWVTRPQPLQEQVLHDPENGLR
jgi:hypothetical protein